jgi:hypothetical protein
MIPMKNSTIFKSRWMAVLWAAGIIWFAYDFAGSQPQVDDNASANSEQASDGSNSPTDTDDEKKLADALKSF